MVPVACCVAGSIAFTVELADLNKPFFSRMSGVDQTDAPSFCAVDLHDVLLPDRLIPQLFKPTSETNKPAKPALSPSIQCRQSGVDTAAATAHCQPSNVPACATFGGMQTDDASSMLMPSGAPTAVPS